MKTKLDVADRVFSIRGLYIALVALVAGVLLASDFSHIDDVVYNVVKDENIITVAEMTDSDSAYDRIENGALLIENGDGLKIFNGEISLDKADVIGVKFTVENMGEKKASVCFDLYGGEEFDDPYDEFTVKIPKRGKKDFSRQIAYYRNAHPEKCMIRIFTDDRANLKIKDLKIDRLVAEKDNNAFIKSITFFMLIQAIIAFVYLASFVIYSIRFRGNNIVHTRIRYSETLLQNIALYSFVGIAVTGILAILYGKISLSYPLIYQGGDELGVFYCVKNIAENGLSLVNPNVGGVSGADMFDYPYSDKLSFLMVKIISIFVDNPYKIINLFYFSNYYIIAFIATLVSRKLGVSRINSGVVGILYAFSPYIQSRYEHMWLVPYFTIPLACYLSLNIIRGKISEEEDRKKKMRFFWSGMMIAFLCSFTGMYYAYFSCALFATAMAIRIFNINGKSVKREIYPLCYICSTILGVVINVLPNIVYWRINGINPDSELLKRNNGDAEIYGLKLVQMILPRTEHRIDFFRRITAGYNNHNPLINENVTAAIGIVASIALVFSLVILFTGSKKYKDISYLNIATFIIATIGGLGSIISVAVNIPMRCYNRMSLVIMFLSLLLLGFLLDELKYKFKHFFVVFVSICVLILGVYDQTVNFGSNDSESLSSVQGLMKQIERTTNEGDMIFVMPYDDWPSPKILGSYGHFIGYIETEGLHWSYGAMQGREEALWQSFVSKCDPPEMIEKLKYAGYDGIYFDRTLYTAKYGPETAAYEISNITKAVGREPLVNNDTSKYFWKF